jgi:[ribosomal protein S5]-alanine N-acetyltransferase
VAGTGGVIRVAPVRAADAPRIQALVEDPQVRATTRLPDPYPADGAAGFVARIAAAAGSEYAFGVHADGEGLVGVVGLIDVRPGARQAEIGYWIGRPYWGRGWATAAVGLVVREAVALGLDRLVAHALEDNLASRRVLERNGFRLTGFTTHDHPRWPPGARVAQYRLGG